MVVYAGVFKTEDKAKEASDKLTAGGFEANDVFMITPAEGVEKLKSILGSARNEEFRGMANRMKNAIQAGHTLVCARPKLFFARLIDDTFAEGGAEKVISHSDSTPRFFSQIIGLNTLVFRSRPRVRLWKRPVTEALGKTMLYKRPVTEKLGKTMLFASKPLTARLGKQMLFKSKPLTERLGKPMILSEIDKRD